jgi:protein gp37
MNATTISWTDFSANLLKYRDAKGHSVWGCVKCASGCQNCYSERIALRFNRGGPFDAATMKTLSPYFSEQEAAKLLRSKKITGKRVFIDDMTDLFGEWLSDEIIYRHLGVFSSRPDVTFQVLTKRPERMCRYFTSVNPPLSWSLPNVWLGASASTQAELERVIDPLRYCPTEVRFLSLEPLLAEVSISPDDLAGLSWVIVGCESGPKRRPCNLDWVRSIIDQCRDAGVKCFVKQIEVNGKVSTNPAEWPMDLRVQEMPNGS